MNNKNLIIIVTIGVSLIFAIFSNTPGTTFAQQRPAVTDTQKYNNGYTDGLRSSLEDSRGLNGHGCDPTLSPGHSIPYQNGYAVGYSKGPCKGGSVSSSSTLSIPGLIFPP